MIGNAVKWQTIASIISFGLSLIQVAILARILDLSAFGLVAIVMVVINLSQVFSDLGMANYLVHRQQVSETLNSTVFWIAFACGISLSLLLTGISPLVANLYDNLEISYLLSLAAIAFLPISFSSHMQARFIGDFRLNELAKFDVLSKLFGTLVAVWTAYDGMGAAAIILGGIATNTVKCILLWLYADKGWRPKLLFSTTEAKSAWNYGVYQIGSQLINQFRGNLDNLILGFYIDNSQLGAYNLAKQLIQKPASLIAPIVHKVSLPLLASAQSDMDRMRLLVKKAHAYVVAALIFPYVLFCFLSEELVIILYGIDKVDVSIFIIPLALFWVLRVIGGALVGPLSQGLGKTKIDFYWNLSVLGLYSLVCILSASYGAYALAWGLCALQAILLNIVFIVFFKRIINFNYHWFITPILWFAVLALASVFSSVLLVSVLSIETQYLLVVVLVSFVSFCLYYLLGYLFKGDILDLPNPFQLVKNRRT